MAIVRLGPIVSGISGKVANVVFVNAKRSLVLRPSPVTVHKTSNFLSESRVRLQNIRTAWATLSDLQQSAWNTLANDTPSKNTLGLSSPMRGFQLFVRTNMHLRRNPDTIFEDAPTVSIGPTPRGIGAAFSSSGNFTVNGQPPNGFGLAFFYIYGWPFWVNHDTNSVARLVFLRLQGATSLNHDIRTEWEQHFGTMVEGQRFAIGIATEVGNTPRSVLIPIRSTVTA